MVIDDIGPEISRRETHNHKVRRWPNLVMLCSFEDDELVDATVGHEVLCFLDAYSGYHQIFMHPSNAEKMAFITPLL